MRKFGRHPWIRLAMVCEKQRLGGVSKIIYKYKPRNRSNLTSMEDNKNTVAIRWQKQPPLKIKFSLSFTNKKL
jgi:hypothetical protein